MKTESYIENAIEKEDLGRDNMIQPYDPSKIRINHQNVNLGFLLEKLEHEEIDLNPDFQREGNLWDDVKKSQLIESILLGLPLPSFYFGVDSKSNKWQVVDGYGLQRLSTFQSFWIDESLSLIGLEFLQQYTGLNKSKLSRADLRKISGFKINFYVIEKETPKEAKFLIFERLNIGSLALTSQEIRHVLNQGIPAEFIKELSKLDSFKRATDYKIPSKRQQDRDFVNRFIAFYTQDIKNEYTGTLDSFLNKGMGLLDYSYSLPVERGTISSDFEASMNICYEIFGDDAFRKRYSNDDKRNPISKPLFDSISVSIAKLRLNEQKLLIERKDLFKAGFINLMNDQSFNKSISAGTGQKSNIIIRFEKIQNLIDNTLANG